MNFTVVRPKSRYHPYSSKNYVSTLGDRVYGSSKLSRPLCESLSWSKRCETPAKSEWNWDEIKLTSAQEQVFDKMVDHLKSGSQFFDFLSGLAGCGKSVVLGKFANHVRCHYGYKESCAITAYTGMAAQNVQGVTLHSLLRIFPGQKPFTPLSRDTTNQLFNALSRLRVLIIDEISLISALFLAQIDHRLQEIFGSDNPFGGVSVVVFGDFLQLPPVTSSRVPEHVFSCVPGEYRAVRATVTPKSPSRLWGLFNMLELEENIRAKDREEARVLAAIRLGECTETISGFLHHKCRMDGGMPEDIYREIRLLENEDPDKVFMVLAKTCAMVKALNEWVFNHSKKRIVLEPSTESSLTTTGFSLRGERCSLKLVVGKRVMVTHNLPLEGLANGVMARLVRNSREYLVLERLDNQKTVYLDRKLFTDGQRYWHQFPVVMAEAITVHKSQGMTFDGVVIVTEGMNRWSGGIFYTALSRARSLGTSRIVDVGTVQWSACRLALAELERMQRRSSV
ncbi:hypothetical protein CRE_19750 [Caenorhabditis remanei]|uniref:ATP-dependent DNA helicase n=1 Tax=Caenorhabditis remanei TaxID=31234 RepID=E3MTL8_CAERE|nr:hypothetical protein CRE_19750 [Caenorhabditis remanei]